MTTQASGLEHHPGLAPRTRELYDDLLERLILPTFKSTRLESISPELVRRWHRQTSAKRTAGQAAKAYRLLRRMLNTAMADGRIGRNPCQIKGAGQEHAAERPLVSAEEVFAIAGAIDPWLRAFVLLAGFGGLRRGELLGLQRRHINPLHGSVRVEQQVVFLKGGGREVTAPKTAAGRRTVHLPDVVMTELGQHLGAWTASDPDAWVFVGENGGPLSSASLYRSFVKARAKVDLDHVTPHDLRHAAGTLAAWTGATTRELMARLGHASPRAAMRYQHAAQKRDETIASRLDLVIGTLEPLPQAATGEESYRGPRGRGRNSG